MESTYASLVPWASAANGRVLDLSNVDPSVAGAAGGYGLVTTVRDLLRFLDALLAGRLSANTATRVTLSCCAATSASTCP